MNKHQYICNITDVVSSKATCKRKKVGVVFISKDYEILATGYNGAPRGFPHCTQDNCNETARCVNTVHAEQNGIVQAARRGVSLDKSLLYSNYGPCAVCARMLVNLGVSAVHIREEYHDDEGISILREGGIRVYKWTE
jgi:dCMP deaminase